MQFKDRRFFSSNRRGTAVRSTSRFRLSSRRKRGTAAIALIVILCLLVVIFANMFKFQQQVLKEMEKQLKEEEDKYHRGAAICAIQRDGVRYLDEWVDYNLAIGFEKIYIYDNSDDFEELKKWHEGRSRNANQIVIKHFPGEAKQLAAYGDCGKTIHRARSHSWIAFFDIDEFLVLKEPTKYRTVMDVLDTVSVHAGALAINWEIFLFNNQTKYEPKPVTKRFQTRATFPEQHVKTIARTSMFRNQGSTPHHVNTINNAKTVDTSGNELEHPIWINPKMTTDVLSLQHFYTKSMEEYQSRCGRGRADRKVNKISDPVEHYCKNATRIMIILQDGYPGNVFDDSAWQILKARVPEVYAKYDNERGE